jgi:hypothetical protein
MTVIRLLSIVGLLCAAAVACDSSSDDGSNGQESDSPPMTVSLLQQRSAEGTREVGVRLTNAGADAFTVAAVRLVWSPLPESPLTPKDIEFEPGRTIDLVTTLGQPDCSGYPDPPAKPAAAEIHLAGTDTVVTQRIDGRGQAWLRRLYADECAGAALQAVADVRLLDAWTRIEIGGVPYLRGWIELDRTGGAEPVTVTTLLGTVLLSFDPMRPVRPIATLAGDQQTLRVPVRMGSSNRCDAHGLSGSTQTFLLSAFVRHGDAPAHRVILTPDQATQGRVLEVVHDACGT